MERVDRLRLWVLVLLRVAAVVWAPYAFLALIAWIDRYQTAGRPTTYGDPTFIHDFLQWQGVSNTLTVLGHFAAVAALTFYSRKLACWIVPAARGCPACGYNIGATKSTRCPECGEPVAPTAARTANNAPSSTEKPQ